MQWGGSRTKPGTQLALAIMAVVTDVGWWIVYAVRPSILQLVVALVLAVTAVVQVVRSIRNPLQRRTSEQNRARPL